MTTQSEASLCCGTDAAHDFISFVDFGYVLVV